MLLPCRYLPLKLLRPVPNDITIASAQQPKDVANLAEEIGLYPDEVNLYGKKKAKVALSVLDRLSHVKDGSYVVVTGKNHRCFECIFQIRFIYHMPNGSTIVIHFCDDSFEFL